MWGAPIQKYKTFDFTRGATVAIFLISYDLRNPDFDYELLYASLKLIEAKQVQDSIWEVNTKSSAKTVFNFLWLNMCNGRDRLFVVHFDKTQGYEDINSISDLAQMN
jgi:hypothetical protein